MQTRTSRIVASIAAVLIVICGVIMIGNSTPAKAAERIIEKSISSISDIKSMVMRIDVRTDVRENFSYIDLNSDMVEHTFKIIRDNKSKWRLDKGWRCIVFDGNTKYMWTPDNSMSIKGNEYTEFEEWFSILLDPEIMLLNEKVITEDKNVKYSIEEYDNNVLIEVETKADGDFTNSYLLNSSIDESDTRQEIVFDKQTNLIKSMKIYVIDKSCEILVLDIKSIEYNVSLNESELTKLPQEREWRDVYSVTEPNLDFRNITPETATRMIFNAFERNDMDFIKDVLVEYNLDSIFNNYGGLKVIRLGKSFKSGKYPGVFVPYQVKLSNGDIKKHNLAIRKDNDRGEWIVDGGI